MSGTRILDFMGTFFLGSVLFVQGNPSKPVLGFCEKQSWEPILTKIKKKRKYTNGNECNTFFFIFLHLFKQQIHLKFTQLFFDIHFHKSKNLQYT